MNEEELNTEGMETPDVPSIENQDEISVPDPRDEQIANLNKALHQEREQNKRLKESYFPQSKEVKPDSEGYIDPNELANTIQSNTTQGVNQILREEREWNKCLKKHPEVEDDPVLERAIRGIKATALVNDGEIITYEEAADKLLGKLKKNTDKAVQEAEAKGRTDAQTSEKIQERAVITEPSGGKEDTVAARKESLRGILFDPDSSDKERDAARIELLGM